MSRTVSRIVQAADGYRLAAAGIGLYFLLVVVAGEVGWQHAGLAALAWVCLSRNEGRRRFVRNWWPMILWAVAYDAMRLPEPWILSRVAVRAPYQWERELFLSPSGKIWPFYFADLAAAHGGSLLMKTLRSVCDFAYLMHLWGVPVLMLVIWQRGSESLFRRMLWSFTVLHALTLTLWLIYPAAPPWWVYENGFRQPTPEHSFPRSAARGDSLRALFHLSANRFAAVPSLHGAYPVLLVLVLALEGVGSVNILLAGVYLAAMWFSCVFLNQHYIVDLLLGAATVPIALLAARRPRGDKRVPGSGPLA